LADSACLAARKTGYIPASHFESPRLEILMALKDRLADALLTTPPENARRLATLEAVKAASGRGTDAEIQGAIAAQIGEREAKAGSFAAAGQSELAKAERAEIDALRALLRAGAPHTEKPAATAPKAKKPAADEVVTEPKPLLSKNQLIVGLTVIVLVAVAGYFLLHKAGNQAQTASSTAIIVKPDDRTMGNPKASVVLLEYAAPTCPMCARFNHTVMPKIKEEYIDTGKVFYIFRTFPLGPTDGAVEAIARKCLPADKYFQFLDLMFRNQAKWDPDGYQIDDVGGAVKQMARIMGVTPEEADRCMTDPEELNRTNQVALDAQVRYNVHGTPTLIVNGTVVEGTEETWPGLKAKFDSLLATKK
jgi:protein-disulfide isomerase